MKTLKIFLILLVPAMGFVACKKCDTKPASATTATPANNSNSNVVNGRIVSTDGVMSLQGGDGTTILGSGDDDRDGGDKKKKSR